MHHEQSDTYHDAVTPSRQVDVVEATAIADSALAVKPSLWTKSMLRLYGCLLIGYLCATTNGFDGAVMGLVELGTCFFRHSLFLTAVSVESTP
jgi:hypothetical protein